MSLTVLSTQGPGWDPRPQALQAGRSPYRKSNLGAKALIAYENGCGQRGNRGREILQQAVRGWACAIQRLFGEC